MDDGDGPEIGLKLIYGSRNIICFDISPTTTRQKFTEYLQNWLCDECPEKYSVFFYDKQSKRMVHLNNSEQFYFAALFHSISFENEMEGIRPVVSNDDDDYINLYISAEDSSTPSHLLNGAFPGELQSHLDNIIVNNIHAAKVNSPVFLGDSIGSSYENLIQNNLFDKDPFASNDNREKDIQRLVDDRRVSLITNIQSPLTDHIRMAHDVHSTPKRLNYKSNMGKKDKRTLAYLSGIRRSEDTGKQIRPILLIPINVLQWLKESQSLKLVVICVRETLTDGMRSWWIDNRNEFRIKGYKKNTLGQNPIELPLTLDDIHANSYKLNIILTHIPCKTGKDRKGELVHSLDETRVKLIHPADHDSESSRLLFMISHNGFRVISTIGFSNFIKEPNKKTKVASNTGRNNLDTHIGQLDPQTEPVVTSILESPVQ